MTVRSNILIVVFLFKAGFGFGFGAAPVAETPVAKKILILGDSLTEGYGVSKTHAFPQVLETLLQKQGCPSCNVINGGIRGSTSASAVSRLKWHLKAKPDIIVLALGANDGLRGFKPDLTKANLDTAIKLAKDKGLVVVLAGMKAPPNYGAEYTAKFARVYSELAEKYHLVLIPFLLADVAGERKLNLPDGIHPNEEGYKIVAANVHKYLKPLL